MKFDEDSDEPFLGRSASSQSKGISEQTAEKIDKEMKKIIDDCYKRATKILKDNIDKLHLMSESLVELETLDTAQIDDIMAGAKPRRESDDDSAPKNTDKKSSSIEEPANQT